MKHSCLSPETLKTKIIRGRRAGAISDSFDATMIVYAFDLHVQRGLVILSYSLREIKLQFDREICREDNCWWHCQFAFLKLLAAVSLNCPKLQKPTVLQCWCSTKSSKIEDFFWWDAVFRMRGLAERLHSYKQVLPSSISVTPKVRYRLRLKRPTHLSINFCSSPPSRLPN